MKDQSSRPMRERVRETVEYIRLTSDHRRSAASLPAGEPDSSVRRVVILPADVSDPAGSRGDEAMLTAVIARVRVAWPGVEVDVATVPGAPLDLPGAGSLPVWGAPWRLSTVWAAVADYDALVVIGADVLDGYYSSVTSLRLWLLADLFSRFRGSKRATVVGFSFNERPRWPVLRALRRSVGDQLSINVRDPASYARFTSRTGRSAALVADSAFLLSPGSVADLSVTGWITEQRDEGAVVCGLNIHPMLSATRDATALANITKAVASAARRLIDEQACAWVLIPHDFREVHGDIGLLRELARAINRPAAVHVVEDVLSASQIKALAALLDAVVTGRMHLAIAALGSGTPAAGITYQGKFNGLFVDHFDLPGELLLSAEHAEDGEEAFELLNLLVTRRADFAAAIATKLDHIVALSESNLAGLTEHPGENGR